MLHAILKLFRARKASQAAAPAPAPEPAPAPAPAKRKDRRKLKRAKRRASPGAQKIDPNGPWLDQARGAKR
ncbi:hypothetical protein Q3P04_21390 [Ralstonia pseudosolanacearum]|uniref:hypothetical protein n=1 Tax=Ralstonia pseudosolanacearum TaxID=1310165 RepID=UPI002674E4A6|nr:hypothetical protein [Ralstonia pseudosolanacearum]MDO3583678.1 hypothetical protein [Ralstonia pseudosolanacearum]